VWAVLRLLWQHHALSSEAAQQQGQPAAPAGERQPPLAAKVAAWPQVTGQPGPVAEGGNRSPLAAAGCLADSFEEVDLEGALMADMAAQLPGPLLHQGRAGGARGGRAGGGAASHYSAAAASLYAGYLQPAGSVAARAGWRRRGPVAEGSEPGSRQSTPPDVGQQAAAAAPGQLASATRAGSATMVPPPSSAPGAQLGPAGERQGGGRSGGGKRHITFAAQVVPLGESDGGGWDSAQQQRQRQQEGQGRQKGGLELELVGLEIQERLGVVFLVGGAPARLAAAALPCRAGCQQHMQCLGYPPYMPPAGRQWHVKVRAALPVSPQRPAAPSMLTNAGCTRRRPRPRPAPPQDHKGSSPYAASFKCVELLFRVTAALLVGLISGQSLLGAQTPWRRSREGACTVISGRGQPIAL
jgi:hypothetical protein